MKLKYLIAVGAILLASCKCRCQPSIVIHADNVQVPSNVLVIPTKNKLNSVCADMHAQINCAIGPNICEIDYDLKLKKTVNQHNGNPIVDAIWNIPGIWNVHSEEYETNYLIGDMFDSVKINKKVIEAIEQTCPNLSISIKNNQQGE